MPMQWDDLRFVLAISRSTGLNSAAKLLGMNPSSVYRRMEALENNMGVRLFERLRSGYRLTVAGEELAEAAARIEVEALDVERRVLGTDMRLQGTIRLSVSEALLMHLLADLVQDFRAEYPDVVLEVALSDRYVDLSRRDADIVIRATASPPEHLVGRSVGHVNGAAYAAKHYLDAQGRDLPISAYDWIGYGGELATFSQARWTERNVQAQQVRMRFDSISAVHDAVARGLGCAALPCFVADQDPLLERLPGTFEKSDVQLWVLTHADLRNSARIRAGLMFFGQRLSAHAETLAGEMDSER